MINATIMKLSILRMVVFIAQDADVCNMILPVCSLRRLHPRLWQKKRRSPRLFLQGQKEADFLHPVRLQMNAPV
jgi:hypothetical protein